jgi:hypothetical protein
LEIKEGAYADKSADAFDREEVSIPHRDRIEKEDCEEGAHSTNVSKPRLKDLEVSRVAGIE